MKSLKTETPCHKCGKPATIRYGNGPSQTIRHLSIFDTPVYLVITPARYKCDHCDGSITTTEAYDWCKKGSHITNGLSDYLMRQLIHSTVEDVSKKEKISYEKLTNAVNKAIATEVDWKAYSSLNLLVLMSLLLKKDTTTT